MSHTLSPLPSPQIQKLCLLVLPSNHTLSPLPSPQIQKLCLLVLQALAKDPDHVVIMVSEDIASPLRNVKDKYASDDEVSAATSSLCVAVLLAFPVGLY